MKSRLLTISLVIAIAIPMLTFGQGFSFDNSSSLSQRGALLANLKFGQIEAEQDSITFNYEKSPGRAFLLSAIIPGAGEAYAGAYWRALIFTGVEVTSWVMRNQYNKKGERIERQYKRYADEHWDLNRWFRNGLTNESCGLEGSHHIWVSYNGQEYVANDTLVEYIPDYLDLGSAIQPVKTYEFYENVGKYDQFACGWDDFDSTLTDTVLMSPFRDKYLTDRYECNQALKMATNFVTAIMFNHLISAFDAIIAAKNYSSEEKKYSWNLGLITDYRYRNPLRGVRLSVAF
ncbi:MAG: hypothetical protein DRP89_03915 [Candidatus Neomarinimicrobiota bacterium]|nr:MAG: hypothetical protein DRP89_03915 [Candidatus Neomarinimicrobiota bacterium]